MKAKKNFKPGANAPTLEDTRWLACEAYNAWRAAVLVLVDALEERGEGTDADWLRKDLGAPLDPTILVDHASYRDAFPSGENVARTLARRAKPPYYLSRSNTKKGPVIHVWSRNPTRIEKWAEGERVDDVPSRTKVYSFAPERDLSPGAEEYAALSHTARVVDASPHHPKPIVVMLEMSAALVTAAADFGAPIAIRMPSQKREVLFAAEAVATVEMRNADAVTIPVGSLVFLTAEDGGVSRRASNRGQAPFGRVRDDISVGESGVIIIATRRNSLEANGYMPPAVDTEWPWDEGTPRPRTLRDL